jgi:hypothetical protein
MGTAVVSSSMGLVRDLGQRPWWILVAAVTVVVLDSAAAEV